MTTEILPGSRVRVTITRLGLHVRSYGAIVTSWAKNGNLNLIGDDGKAKSVSSENVKLIRQ